MWLLRTTTAELEHFNSPFDVKGGYAILSHVWQDHEQSFHDLQALRTQLAATGCRHRLRSRVSAKIRDCCILAKSHGYDWLWIDTCCIDRTSSAELSEAINSMYEWYAHSQVCYVYLHDVPNTRDLHSRASPFRESRWFTRGWTLQELIAPRSLVFLAEDWSVLGTKAGLADLLETITGVDADVLTFRRDLGSVSVARRMSWASHRKTTRPEDEAYSLMGIFGVHMATIYGEGHRAFRRLQEEILKRTSDQTLFAWGNVLPIRTAPFREQMAFGSYHPDNHMFAPSPAAFSHSANMVPISMKDAVENALKGIGIKQRSRTNLQGPSTKSMRRLSDDAWNFALPDFMVTTHGMRARLLVIESSSGQSILAVAVLACKDTTTGSFVGLLLRRRAEEQGATLKYPRYHVGVTIRGMHVWMRLRYRLSHVDWVRHALSFNSGGITARWQQLYLSHRPPSRSPAASNAAQHKHGAAFRFYFPRWLEIELGKQGFRPDVKLPASRSDASKLPQRASIATFTFTHQHMQEAFRIHVGQCRGVPWAVAGFMACGSSPARTSSSSWPSRYQTDVPSFLLPPPAPGSDCSVPQGPSIRVRASGSTCSGSIASWPNGTRTFGDAERNVQLTFTRANSGSTHILDVRVGGHRFKFDRLAERWQAGRRLVHRLCTVAGRV
ncbi:heterokaryon incompatibility protein-domain-containing protein [Trametes maxima]|nr:heterokaryon incompatibility protein-domain-containing protein [Trametes maxima]